MAGLVGRVGLVGLVGRIALVVAALAVAQPAHASFRTRLMDPFDIGAARSLPWSTDAGRGRADYKIAGLISDTEALLTPNTPVVVRLETLRRAVLYASTDRHLAQRLLNTFLDRARRAEASGAPDALAYLDAAFVNDLFQQIGDHYNPPFTSLSAQVRGLAGLGDGYGLVQKGLALHSHDDPAYQFGAALIAGVKRLGEAAFTEHALAARAGANRDLLLMRNLPRIYADRVAELQAQTARRFRP